METQICKITFSDGAWVKAELPVGAGQIDYVLDHFGMFASIEVLPADDAAVVANKAAPLSKFVSVDEWKAQPFFREMQNRGARLRMVS